MKIKTELVRPLFYGRNFQDSKMIDGLQLAEMYLSEIVVYSPVCVGTSLFDLSKLCIARFRCVVVHFGEAITM